MTSAITSPTTTESTTHACTHAYLYVCINMLLCTYDWDSDGVFVSVQILKENINKLTKGMRGEPKTRTSLNIIKTMGEVAQARQT